MSYVNLETKQIVEGYQILNENPNVSFPTVAWTDELLNEFGYAELWDDGERPATDRYQKVVSGTPEKREDGKWYKTFTVEDCTPEEIAFIDSDKKFRTLELRSTLLKNSDWTQLSDVPLTETEKGEWATYRQSLRDIPSQEGYPWDIVWPIAPTSV